MYKCYLSKAAELPNLPTGAENKGGSYKAFLCNVISDFMLQKIKSDTFKLTRTDHSIDSFIY